MSYLGYKREQNSKTCQKICLFTENIINCTKDNNRRQSVEIRHQTQPQPSILYGMEGSLQNQTQPQPYKPYESVNKIHDTIILTNNNSMLSNQSIVCVSYLTQHFYFMIIILRDDVPFSF